MSDIVGLIVVTRLGLMRVLHWVDQALLCLHVGDDLDTFRRAGIRTATDFEATYMGLPQPQLNEFQRESEEGLARKMQEEGRVYIPAVPPQLVAALGGDKQLGERARSQMIAICSDENFSRLKTMRLKQIVCGELPR